MRTRRDALAEFAAVALAASGGLARAEGRGAGAEPSGAGAATAGTSAGLEALGRIEARLVDGEDGRGRSLPERMAAQHVPAVSVAFFDAGELAWARAYGRARAGAPEPAALGTRFQAGSLSKGVAATTAMRLVGRGVVSLDADLRGRLRAFGVGDGVAQPGDVVSLRALLSHTAGLNVHGFIGYYGDPTLPGLEDIVHGDRRSNSVPIEFVHRPGSAWDYSGGGYVVVQRYLEATTDRPFAQLAQTLLFGPAGLRSSTYTAPSRAALARGHAWPHDGNGMPLPEGPHVYPEQTAAGLWTTALDLARFALGIAQAYRGDTVPWLPSALARELLRPVQNHYGLGLAIEGEGADSHFGHGGDNAGYHALITAYPERGQSLAVMTNAEGGAPLMMEVAAAVGREYGWPAPQRPAAKQAQALAPAEASAAGASRAGAPSAGEKSGAGETAAFARCVGHYRIPGGPPVEISAAGEGLIARTRTTLFPSEVRLETIGPDRFRAVGAGLEVRFDGHAGLAAERIVFADAIQGFRVAGS